MATLNVVGTSKFLSRVLRHEPEMIGVEMDKQGWVDINQLLEKAKALVDIDHQQLRYVVETSDKQRFAISECGSRIRANQGHSVDIDLGLEPQEPPMVLYHGTYLQAIRPILRHGLKKMSRRHVHLSESAATANVVGARHGLPIVLVVSAFLMRRDGIKFYRSANGVWLVDHIPLRYLEF